MQFLQLMGSNRTTASNLWHYNLQLQNSFMAGCCLVLPFHTDHGCVPVCVCVCVCVRERERAMGVGGMEVIRGRERRKEYMMGGREIVH